jgi:hypothetical protein
VVVVLLVGRTAAGGEGWERVPVGSHVEHRWVGGWPAIWVSHVGSEKKQLLMVTGFGRPLNVHSHFMGHLGNHKSPICSRK